MWSGPGVGPARIAPSALKAEMWRSLWSATFAVERKHGGRWVPVAQFRNADDATEFIDEAVGQGLGDLDDYEIAVIHKDRADWLKWGVITALIAIAAAVVLSFILR